MFKKLLAILLSILMLSACVAEEIPEPVLPEEPVASEPENIENDEISETQEDFSFENPKVLYQEFLTEELEASPAFKGAMKKPSVIVYDKEPITNPDAALNFVEAFKKGEYSEFHYYSFSYSDFYDNKTLYYQHFTTKDGLVYREGAYLYDWENDFEPSEKTVHNFVVINDYGYFGIGWGWKENWDLDDLDFDDITYHKVISDFAIYENEAENRVLKEKYIDPIFTITVSPKEFASVLDLSGTDLLWLFEDIYNHENGYDPWQEYGNNWPVADMLELLNRYFDGVTKEMIVSQNKFYDSDSDVIYYEGGRGGVPPEIKVIGFSEEENLLTLNYVLYNGESGWIDESCEIVLKIRILDDGSFRYLSQKVIEKE